jgi:hypothetical protein
MNGVYNGSKSILLKMLTIGSSISQSGIGFCPAVFATRTGGTGIEPTISSTQYLAMEMSVFANLRSINMVAHTKGVIDVAEQ